MQRLFLRQLRGTSLRAEAGACAESCKPFLPALHGPTLVVCKAESVLSNTRPRVYTHEINRHYFQGEEERGGVKARNPNPGIPGPVFSPEMLPSHL